MKNYQNCSRNNSSRPRGLDINAYKDKIKQAIDGKDANVIVELSEELGKSFCDKEIYHKKTLSTSKIRNIFDSLKKLEMKWKGKESINQLILLQPKLVYSANRDKATRAVKDFVEVLKTALSFVLEKKDDEKELNRRFKNFSKFYEAILCYHKAYGGK